jgi:hypothetical protein
MDEPGYSMSASTLSSGSIRSTSLLLAAQRKAVIFAKGRQSGHRRRPATDERLSTRSRSSSSTHE